MAVLHADLVGPLPKGRNSRNRRGFQYILSVVYSATGYLWLLLLRHKTAEAVAAALFDEVISRVRQNCGALTSTDRGGEITGVSLQEAKSERMHFLRTTWSPNLWVTSMKGGTVNGVQCHDTLHNWIQSPRTLLFISSCLSAGRHGVGTVVRTSWKCRQIRFSSPRKVARLQDCYTACDTFRICGSPLCFVGIVEYPIPDPLLFRKRHHRRLKTLPHCRRCVIVRWLLSEGRAESTESS